MNTNKRTPARLQAEYAADMKKFSDKGAALDADGKFQVYILYEDDPDGAMAYFFDRDFRRVRLFTSTFYRLLDESKAVRVNRDGKKK